MQLTKKIFSTITSVFILALSLFPSISLAANQQEHIWKFNNPNDYNTSKEATVFQGLAKLAGNRDAGKTWENVTNQSLSHNSQNPHAVKDLIYNPNNQNIYAFTNPYGDIYTSSDNGKTWNFKSSLWDTNFDTITKTILLSNGNFLSLVRCSSCLEATFSDGVLKSNDQGATWTKDITLNNFTNPRTITIAGEIYTINEATDIFQAKNGKIYVAVQATDSNGVYRAIILESTSNNSLANFTGYLLDSNNDLNIVLNSRSITQHSDSHFYATIIKSDPTQTVLQILRSKGTNTSSGFEIIKEIPKINNSRLIQTGSDGHLYIIGTSYDNGSYGVIIRSDSATPTLVNNNFTVSTHDTSTGFTDLLNSSNGRMFTTSEKSFAINKTNDGDVYHQDPANAWSLTPGKLVGAADSTALTQSSSTNYIFAGASLPLAGEVPEGVDVYRTCETFSEGYVQNKIGIDFKKIIKFEDQLGIQQAGNVKYQISINGTDWYFHNGTKWTKTTQGSNEANSSQDIDKNIPNLLSDLGLEQGKFFFKAYLTPTSSDKCANIELAQVRIVQESDTPITNIPKTETTESEKPTILAKTGTQGALVSISLVALGFLTLGATYTYLSRKQGK